MLVELLVKEYEKPYVHTLKNKERKENHHIKEHTQLDNNVHPVWVTSLGLVSRVGEG